MNNEACFRGTCHNDFAPTLALAQCGSTSARRLPSRTVESRLGPSKRSRTPTDCRTVPGDHPAIRSRKAEPVQATSASDVSVLHGKKDSSRARIISMHERDLQEARERVLKRWRGASLLPRRAWSSTELRWRMLRRAFQERRSQREHLHTQAAAKASNGAEATQLVVLFPDGLTKRLPQEAKVSIKRATDLFDEELKAAAKEAAAPPSKGEWRSVSSEACTTKMSSSPRRESKTTCTSLCRRKPEVTRSGWRDCDHKWPGISVPLSQRRSQSKGDTTGRRVCPIRCRQSHNMLVLSLSTPVKCVQQLSGWRVHQALSL